MGRSARPALSALRLPAALGVVGLVVALGTATPGRAEDIASTLRYKGVRAEAALEQWFAEALKPSGTTISRVRAEATFDPEQSPFVNGAEPAVAAD